MIKINMEMPKSCYDCRMVDDEFGYCHAVDVIALGKRGHYNGELWKYEDNHTKPEWCPLIEDKDYETQGNN